MKLVGANHVGERVRATILYPQRGVFCPKTTWTYEGTVERVRDVAGDIRASGLYPDHEARRHEGEFHVTLREVTATSDPPSRLGVEQIRSVVLSGHEDVWEKL